MPKRVMKQKVQQCWPAPKKGKGRANLKRPAAPMNSNLKIPFVPYVRVKGVQTKFRKERARYGVSVHSLTNMSSAKLIAKLTQDGILPQWTGKTCPHCASARLGSLKFFAQKQVWVHRCSRKGCSCRVQPHDFHPIFFGGRGQSFTPLGHQAAVLLCAIAGVPVTSVPAILDMDDKAVFRIYQNLEVARARHVELKEKNIVFGEKMEWCDVEADEVDLGKELSEDKQTACWEQWGGLVERGRPTTLMLFRLNPPSTQPRSPGPGAIRRRDWKPIARKHLQDRRVLLHTDGARAYKMKMPGVIHDNVVHKKKKVMVKGRPVWVKPHYTKIVKHTLPSGKTIHVKAGTQIIDRVWGHVRAYLKHSPRRVGSMAVKRKVRAAQWTYWHKGENLWKATGQMLKDLHG